MNFVSMEQCEHFRSANIRTFSFLFLVKHFNIFQYFLSQIKLEIQTKVLLDYG